MNSLNFWRRVKRVALFGLLGILTVLSSWANKMFTGDVYPYQSVDRTVGLEALERSQGVTTDGASWIFSGKDVLLKVSIDDDTILARNKKAIPDAFREQFGSAHIGGISYANNCVYAAIEDSGAWAHPIVALFDGETLAYTGKYVELPGKDSGAENAMTHGVPWVACDQVNGFFYVAECDDADKLFAYDLETMEYVRSIPLSEPIDEIQGGEMYNGRLFVATNDATRAVYRISLRTGKVDKYFDRILYQPKRIDNFGGEGEDLTVLPMRDGTVFHALNIGALFVDANLRHYAPVQPDLPFEALADDDEPQPKPDEMYLNKFGLDILKDGCYTITAASQADGTPLSVTLYSDTENFAVKVNVLDLLAQDRELPDVLRSLGDVRMVTQHKTTDPKTYLACALGYAEIDDVDETLTDLFRSAGDNLSRTLLSDDLQYLDRQYYTGFTVERYMNTETNEIHAFYFDARGLSRLDVIDPETNTITQTTSITLTRGVTDPDAFALKGRQYTADELQALFDGLS